MESRGYCCIFVPMEEKIVRNGKTYIKVSENKSLEQYCKIYIEETVNVFAKDRELLIITTDDEEHNGDNR